MTAIGYLGSRDVLSDRIRWSRALLTLLIDRGREEGWLEGPRLDPIALGSIEDEIAEKIAGSVLHPTVMPMEWMALRLEIEPHELALLWLLACIEISPAVARLACTLGREQTHELSLQLVRLVVPLADSELDALERRGLIEITAAPHHPHAHRMVRVNDRVVALARGELELDRELQDIARIHRPSAGSALEVPPALAMGLRASPAPLLMAVGPVGAGRATILANAAASMHGTLRVGVENLSRDQPHLRRQLRAVLRESALFNVIPMFEELGASGDTSVTVVLERELRTFAGPVMATVTEPIRISARPVVVHHIEKPDVSARRAMWRANLGTATDDVIERAASQYALWPGAIAAAANNAQAIAGTTNVSFEMVHQGVRAHLGEQLAGIAHRVECRQTWNDVVLPGEQFDQLIELVARVRRRGQVLETWGFGDKIGKGLGVAALFSGPPGTGKTMVAALIAKELGLDLYQVDLSKVVSKYIGETEKQLAALFDAAETGQAIILFDEADSLFAKRSEVKSSNDRYANLEVNYLLQRLEAFTGIALLTTNHERSLDEAFRRRIALHVRFPMPEEAQRSELWRAMLPAAAEVTDDIDTAELARNFELSGGYIKNAVLRAAYVAADKGSAISMTHLWRAARAEYESIGKIAHQREA